MTKLFIFGDSFSSSQDSGSWTQLLKNHCEVEMLSANGSSEYRIWKTYKNSINNIQESDKIIFCHTSYTRIFLKDTILSKSRQLRSHPKCDLILEDVFTKNEKDFISIIENIWDEDYLRDTYSLIIKDLLTVKNSFHITFFDNVEHIESLNHCWKQHPGTINHMNRDGNLLVYDFLKQRLFSD